MPFCVALGVVMPRSRDEHPAVRVYTVCDESRYLIVRNVPALGCGEELLKLLGTYGDIEEFVSSLPLYLALYIYACPTSLIILIDGYSIE